MDKYTWSTTMLDNHYNLRSKTAAALSAQPVVQHIENEQQSNGMRTSTGQQKLVQTKQTSGQQPISNYFQSAHGRAVPSQVRLNTNSDAMEIDISPQELQKRRFTQAALELARPNHESREALKTLVDETLAVPMVQNQWQPPLPLSDNQTQFLNAFREAITSVANKPMPTGQALTNDSEYILRTAAQQAFQKLGSNFSLEKPLSFFVYDTETNRLFGDVSQLGWIRLDINTPNEIKVDCQNIILPPNFMTHGAERVHKLSLDWMKQQHQQGNTTPQEEAALRWLQHAVESKSIIGFNLLYDQNAMKRLFHGCGVDAKKVDQLFSKLSNNYALDAQDYLLRVDPFTRQEHYLPFSDTKKSRAFAEKEFENRYPNGQPIEYMPNRKLVSYAQGFLGMKTEGAHDALFDCVLTIGGFVHALALRNDTLKNENLSNAIENPLSQYSRIMHTSDPLTKRINTPAPRGEEDHPVYSKAASPVLAQNPMLKTTPFIFKSTGQTVHRRHIIPKSKLAELLVLNGNITEQNKLYQNILQHPGFKKLALDHLSPQAMNFCQSISALLQGQKTSQSFFTNNTIQLLENIEKTQINNTKLRYFERGLAAEMIEKLPTSDEIKQAGAVTEEQAHHILTAVMYSFFHSLELNQFVGQGADNMLAGKVFHALEKDESPTLEAIANAKSTTQVKAIIKQWLEKLESSLAQSLEQTPLANAASVQTEEAQSAEAETEGKMTSDALFYALEQSHSDMKLLDVFFDATPKIKGLILKSQNTDPVRNETLQIIERFLKVGFHQTGRQATFKDQSVFTELQQAHKQLSETQEPHTIQKLIKSFYTNLPKVHQKLKNSDLYASDKAMLSSYLLRITSHFTVKPQVLETLADFQPVDNKEPQTKAQPLLHLKKAASSFIKSIMDSTSIDLSQAAAGPLQNASLLPLITAVEKDRPNVESATAFFRGLIDVEHDIESRLNLKRQVAATAPLVADYMDFLY